MNGDKGKAREVPHALDVASAYSWRFLTVVAAGAVVVYVLVTLRLIVIPAFVALLISTLLVPVARTLRKLGLPSLLATWTTLVAAAGVVVLLGLVFAPRVVDQLDDVGRDARRGFEDALSWLAEGPLNVTRTEVEGYLDQAEKQLRESTGPLITGAFRGVYLIGEVLAGILLTFVLIFYFVKDGDRIGNAMLGFFSEDRRETLRTIATRSWDALGAYMRGTAVVGVVDAFAIGLTLLIVGVPLVLPLVMLTFIGAFFPLVGAVVAGTLAALVALVTTGVVPALIVAGVTIVVQQVEGDLLQPLVLSRAVRLHPLVILLALTAGAIVAGVAGAFLAVPVAAVVSVALSTVRDGSPAQGTAVSS